MKSILLLFEFAFRNIWRNPKRSIVTLSAITVGICSAVVLSSIARGLSRGMAENAIKTLTGHIQIHAPNFLDDPTPDKSMNLLGANEISFLTQNGIKKIAARVRIPGMAMSERESYGLVLVGISPIEESGVSFISEAPIEGRMLTSESDPGIVVGQDLLRVLKTSVGKRIVVMAQSSEGKIADRGFKIVGAFSAELRSTEKSFAFIGRSVAQEMLLMNHNVSEFVLRIDNAEKVAPIVEKIQARFPEFEIKSWQELEPLVMALRKVQDGFLIIWFFIVVLAVSFGVINTQLMAIFERTRELGVLMALGVTQFQIVIIVCLESFLMLVIGVLLGNALGLCGVFYLRHGIDLTAFAAASEQLGFARIIFPHVFPRDWLICDLLLFVMGILGSFYPAYLASRLNPVEAISGRA